MNQKGFALILVLVGVFVLIIVGLITSIVFLRQSASLAPAFPPPTINNQENTSVKLTGKMAFVRQGMIWLAKEDGSDPIQISNLPNQNHCQFYTVDSDYDYINGESAWSKNGDKLAYYCPDLDNFILTSNTQSLMYIYDLQTKTTQSFPTAPSICHGCAGSPINFKLLVKNPEWQSPYDSYSVYPTLHNLFPLQGAKSQYASQIDQAYPVGGPIYVLAPDPNAISNPNKDYYWLYDLNTKKILYRWGGGEISHEYKSTLYTYYTDVPRCSLNRTESNIACEFTLFKDESQSTGNLHQLLVLNISTGQIRSLYQPTIPFNHMWSTDGSSIYYDSLYDTNNTKIVVSDRNLISTSDLIFDASYPYPDYSLTSEAQ